MTRYLSLAEYVWLAEQVTGVEAAVLAKASQLDLADSPLHAPAAGFADQEFYPDIVDKAAVLTCRPCVDRTVSGWCATAVLELRRPTGSGRTARTPLAGGQTNRRPWSPRAEMVSAPMMPVVR